VVDSDETPLHVGSHEISDGHNLECRLCQLRRIVSSELGRLNDIPNRPTLKTAIGLAVPSIEAWYLCGRDSHVNENTWGRKLEGEPITYDRNSLKKTVYGTDRTSTVLKKEKAVEAAHRIAMNLDLLFELFPYGFGSFLRDLDNW
jgi:hypothetical protein